MSAFANGMPYSSDKLRYIMQDLLRCATHEAIPLRMPSAKSALKSRTAKAALRVTGATTAWTTSPARWHAPWCEPAPWSSVREMAER